MSVPIPKDQLKEELKKIIHGEQKPISGDSKINLVIGSTNLLIDSPFMSVEDTNDTYVTFIQLADPPQTNIAKLKYGSEFAGINKAEFKDLQVPLEQQVWEPLFGLPTLSSLLGATAPAGGRRKTRSRKHKRKTRKH